MNSALKIFLLTIAFASIGIVAGREIAILDIIKRGYKYPTGIMRIDLNVSLREVFCGTIGGILGLIIGILIAVKKPAKKTFDHNER